MVLEQHGQLGWIRSKARSEEAARQEHERVAESAIGELEGARERIDELMAQEARMSVSASLSWAMSGRGEWGRACVGVVVD